MGLQERLAARVETSRILVSRLRVTVRMALEMVSRQKVAQVMVRHRREMARTAQAMDSHLRVVRAVQATARVVLEAQAAECSLRRNLTML